MRKSTLVKKIKTRLNDLLQIQRQSSKEYNSQESEDEELHQHNQDQEIFQLAHSRIPSFQFNPIEIKFDEEKSPYRFKISPQNILFDFYPTFNEMNTQM